ncbi:SrfA family protein [Magnetospirillum molischianum]|uniref:Virulence factor n=1 Tax=Magnetospirillum molischianum DSM 120 TaxID=1150626 RepID=H8FWR2_MAGML|nr:SrfA family protein [Magnetospirillum molischianum]CCG42800.1 conserved hypothetical protein [Magnetospirillum molischianum DSM 120]
MGTPLLRSGSLREYNALGVLGNPVFGASAQLSATVRRQLGPEAAEMLAVPQINEAGNRVDWYAPFDGPVVPWSAATAEERTAAFDAMQRMRSRFEGHSAQLRSQLAGNARGETAPEIFARMLPLAMHIPDESHIHLVGGRPVLTFWGFELLHAAPGGHVIRDLSLATATPAATAATAAVVAVPLVAASRSWGCLRWLLLPLILLLLLLFLLFGLNSCAVPLPAWVASVPGASLILPQAQGPDGSIPGVVVPGVTEPGIVVPGGVVGSDDQVVPPIGTEGSVKPPQPDAKDEKDQPQDKSEPPVPQHPDQKDPKDKSADAKTLPPVVPPRPDKPPLTIPDEAAKNGNTSFLNGRWHSRTGLMDSDTGRPLDMEYDFKDGKGTATIHRSDGTSCTAGATAAMVGSKLMIDQSGDVVCPDGRTFDRSRVECTPGKNGKADCKGQNANTKDGYRVEIVK